VALISAQLATEHALARGKDDHQDLSLKRKLVERTDSIIKAICESTDYADILKVSAQQLVEHLPADRCLIITLSKGQSEATYFEACTVGVESCPANKTAKLNFALLRKASGGLEAIAMEEATKDPGLVEHRLILQELKINSIMACALFYKSEVVGMVVVHRCTKGVSWSESERTMLSTVAGHIAVAVSNARQFRAMQTLAITDKLTNLYNRRFFEERMLAELTNARRQKYPLSVALLDIDHFKKVNDTFGHAAGDKVLCKLGFVLRTNLRKGTVVARFGGEEFVVILPNIHLGLAHRIMDGVRKLVSETFKTKDGQAITISVGVEEAVFDSQIDLGTLQKTTIEKADTYLYQAKRTGRNRVCSAANLGLEPVQSC
jgi:diguanylate cyclase (GGDEF)-like protein